MRGGAHRGDQKLISDLIQPAAHTLHLLTSTPTNAAPYHAMPEWLRFPGKPALGPLHKTLPPKLSHPGQQPGPSSDSMAKDIVHGDLGTPIGYSTCATTRRTNPQLRDDGRNRRTGCVRPLVNIALAA
jgi:hypothetical protein